MLNRYFAAPAILLLAIISIAIAEGPASQPASQPTSQPAKPKMVPSLWFNAKVGDMVKQRDSLGQSSIRTIIKVDDDTVTIETSGEVNGKPIGAKHTYKEPRMVPADQKPFYENYGENAVIKDLPPETLTISGQKILCKVRQFTYAKPQPMVRTFWLSDQVPGRVVRAKTVSPKLNYVNEIVELKLAK